MQVFEYPFPPLGGHKALERVLECSGEELKDLESDTSRLYRPVEVEKRDGSSRKCFDPTPRLKRVQGLLKHRILSKVRFPIYVQGGVRDIVCPRDYVANAALHVGSTLLINLDIANFFPSTNRDLVFRIWHQFFHMKKELAETLTNLTTLDGFLPQGAPTSSYLANLVFWKDEPRLVKMFEGMGIRYSRYVDDVAISCSKPVDAEKVVGNAIGAFRQMASKYGFKLKNRKTEISTLGQRMQVTGLVVSDKVGLASERKGFIRSSVKRLEYQLSAGTASLGFDRELSRTSSQIGQMSRVNPGKARRLKARIDTVRKGRV